MNNKSLKEVIEEWVLLQEAPFLSRDIFESIDEIENITQVSQVMNEFFNKGIVARKKIDGVKFSYIASAIAPADFELLEQTSVAKEVRSSPKPKSSRAQNKNTKESIVKPTISSMQEAEKEEKQNAIQLPAIFTLKLETQSGLVITITSDQVSI